MEELLLGCPARVSTAREEHGITLFSGMFGCLTFIVCFVLACGRQFDAKILTCLTCDLFYCK